jgi:hypothetical protein
MFGDEASVLADYDPAGIGVDLDGAADSAGADRVLDAANRGL